MVIAENLSHACHLFVVQKACKLLLLYRVPSQRWLNRQQGYPVGRTHVVIDDTRTRAYHVLVRREIDLRTSLLSQQQ